MKTILQSMIWTLCTVGIICAPPDVHAQSISATAVAEEDADPQQKEPLVSESLPSIIYTYNEAGELIKWVDSFPFREYHDLLTSLKNDTKFVITDLTLEAEARESHAALKTTMLVRTLVDGLQVVPIKMGEMHLQAQPTSSGKPVFVQPNEKFGEYELLIDGKKQETVEIQFESMVPLKRIGLETHLRLSIPRVAVSSLTLTVPAADVECSAGEDIAVQSLPIKTPETDEPGAPADAMLATTSKFRINGLPPRIELSWRPKSEGPAEAETLYQVRGNIEVTVDALGGITSDAVLTINAFNRPIKRVLVRLPAHTRWVDNDDGFGNYKVEEAGISEDDRQALEVVFAEESTKPPVVRLLAIAEEELSTFVLDGFEVVGATTQSGTVSVYSEGTRSLNWRTGEFALRISSPATGRRPEATFEYSRPKQVMLDISRQSPTLVVEPVYRVVVRETKVELNAAFRCTKRGGSPTNLTFDLQDWTLLSLGPDPNNVVLESDEIVIASDDKLKLPLEDPPDQFEVSFDLMLPLEEGLKLVRATSADNVADGISSSDLNLKMPFPLDVSAILQSTMVISTSPSVTITPRESAEYTEIGLPDELRTEMTEGENPLCLRMRSSGPPAPLSLLAGKLERLTEIDCDIDLVDVGAQRLRVRQDMKWRVTDVPLPFALLTMNEKLFAYGELQVAVNGRSVVFSRSPSLADSSTNAVIIKVPLEPKLGDFDMSIAFNWSEWDDNGNESEIRYRDTLNVDLVLPKRSSSLTQRMLVHCRFLKPRLPDHNATLAYYREDFNLAWTSSRDLLRPDPDIEAFVDSTAPTMPMFLPITIEPVEESATAQEFKELVDRAWFQTWYTHSTRTDRAVFRVQGGDTSIRLELPDAEILRRLNPQVFIDGARQDYRKIGDQTIELEVDANAASSVVEIQYTMPSREPPGILETKVPRIEGADILGQWYWHVVMPRNECMLTWPRTLTRAHYWDWWSLLIPRRKPELTLEELEVWSGATKTGATVLAGSSEYLFGAMGEADTLSIRTTPLPIYVMLVAGSILVFGLMFLYSRRRVVVLGLVGVAIGGLIFLHPSYASIAGQVAVFGVLLVAVATLLSWLLRQTGRSSLAPNRLVTRVGSATLDRRRSSFVSQGTTALITNAPQLQDGHSP